MNVNRMDTPEPKLLRLKDVIARVQLSKGHIRRLEEDGQFPPRIKLGASVRWRTSDIDDWLAGLGGRQRRARRKRSEAAI